MDPTLHRIQVMVRMGLNGEQIKALRSWPEMAAAESLYGTECAIVLASMDQTIEALLSNGVDPDYVCSFLQKRADRARARMGDEQS